jgi:hypothetical protein
MSTWRRSGRRLVSSDDDRPRWVCPFDGGPKLGEIGTLTNDPPQDPPLMRVLDRLDDTPDMVLSDLSETLAQNRPAVALLGDQTGYTGPARSAVYRWFTDPAERLIYPEADREAFGRLQVSTLRAVTALPEPGTRTPALALVEQLRLRSTEFDQLWQPHEVGLKAARRKHLNHPELGLMELDCQFLVTENRGQALLIFTAVPGTEDHEKPVEPREPERAI